MTILAYIHLQEKKKQCLLNMQVGLAIMLIGYEF